MSKDYIYSSINHRYSIHKDFHEKIKSLIRECPFCPIEKRIMMVDSGQWKEHIVEHIKARHAAHSD